MPLYEYRCGHCGHEVELLRKVSDQSTIACPSCGATDMHKKVTAAGFQLKGTGWYVTDFRNGGKSAPRGDKPAEGDAPAAGGNAEAGKADASSAGGGKSEAAAPGSVKGDTASAGGGQSGSGAAGSASPPATPSSSAAG